MRVVFSLVLGVVFLLSCGSKADKWPEVNLLEYGVPISVKAPEGAEVKVDDLGFWKDVTVKNGKDYYLQIMASTATTYKMPEIIAEQKKAVQNAPFFSKFIEENESGFIYEKKVDDLLKYDFRYIKIEGNNEYVFQTGLVGDFTENQVRDMYQAAIQE